MHRNANTLAALGAVLATTLASTAQAAPDDGLAAQVEALRRMVEQQQAQLDAQQRQIEAQRAELDALKGRPALDAPAVAAAPATPTDAQRIEALETQAAQAKIAAREVPSVKMNSGRIAVTSADGRSSLALRGNVQADFAHYDQSPPGKLCWLQLA